MGIDTGGYIVDILMLAFNHDKYIAEAIESVLMQKTDFNYRLIISEDCSSDGTYNICKHFSLKYKDKILLLSNTENLGLAANYRNIINKSTSKYIALLEADDYWIDAYKLQKQILILEQNEEIGLVHTGYIVLYENGLKKRANILSNKNKLQGNILKSLLKENIIAPLTVCFRANLIKDNIDFDYFVKKKYSTIDYALWLEIAANSKIAYIHEDTSVYRILSTSISNTHDPLKIINFYKTSFDLYESFFLKNKEYQIYKRQTINNIYILIAKALVIKDNFQIAQVYSENIQSINIESLIIKTLLKKECYFQFYLYLYGLFSKIKQSFSSVFNKKVINDKNI